MRFTPQAIKASFLVEHPDWYQYEITKHFTKKSADGQSTNHFLIFTGENGEMKDVPVTTLFNEKADWSMVPLFTAANGGELPDPDKEYNFEDLVGIHLECFTKRGARQDGTPMNQLTEYRPISVPAQ